MMKYLIQDWKNKDLKPLLDNDTDLIVIKNTPPSQLKILNYITQYYDISPQFPMDKIFVDILMTENSHELYGNTDLEWHIDKGYTSTPINLTTLYALEIEGDVGRTMYVDTRIKCPIPNKKVSVDMDRFTSSQKYGYRFKSEAERRWFRRQHRNVEHDLIQKDKRGEYVFYCEAYTELPIEEKKQIESLIYQPERIYYHTWEKGDLLLANNMVTNHTRESTKYGKRHLWKLEGFKNEK